MTEYLLFGRDFRHSSRILSLKEAGEKNPHTHASQAAKTEEFPTACRVCPAGRSLTEEQGAWKIRKCLTSESTA